MSWTWWRCMNNTFNFSRLQAAVRYKQKQKNKSRCTWSVSAANAPCYHKQGLLVYSRVITELYPEAISTLKNKKEEEEKRRKSHCHEHDGGAWTTLSTSVGFMPQSDINKNKKTNQGAHGLCPPLMHHAITSKDYWNCINTSTRLFHLRYLSKASLSFFGCRRGCSVWLTLYDSHTVSTPTMVSYRKQLFFSFSFFLSCSSLAKNELTWLFPEQLKFEAKKKKKGLLLYEYWQNNHTQHAGETAHFLLVRASCCFRFRSLLYATSRRMKYRTLTEKCWPAVNEIQTPFVMKRTDLYWCVVCWRKKVLKTSSKGDRHFGRLPQTFHEWVVKWIREGHHVYKWRYSKCILQKCHHCMYVCHISVTVCSRRPVV